MVTRQGSGTADNMAKTALRGKAGAGTVWKETGAGTLWKETAEVSCTNFS